MIDVISTKASINMRIIVVLLTAILVNRSFSQRDTNWIYLGNVIPDTSTLLSVRPFDPLPSILRSTAKIEVRLGVFPSFKGPQYTVLTFDHTWSGNYSSYNRKLEQLTSVALSDTVDLAAFFSQLVENEIFALPNQRSLELAKYYYDLSRDEVIGEGMDMADGISYAIEFKIDEFFRRYSFWEPAAFADFYPNIHELRSYANIVALFTALTTNK